jgi:hypothetical protein
MFLYSEPGLHATAYFITPDPEGSHIQHQYGCVSCLQFEMNGKVEVVPEPLASTFAKYLGECSYASEEALSLQTGIHVVDVLGEGLCQLEDGRYVAVCNCD